MDIVAIYFLQIWDCRGRFPETHSQLHLRKGELTDDTSKKKVINQMTLIDYDVGDLTN